MVVLNNLTKAANGDILAAGFLNQAAGLSLGQAAEAKMQSIPSPSGAPTNIGFNSALAELTTYPLAVSGPDFYRVSGNGIVIINPVNSFCPTVSTTGSPVYRITINNPVTIGSPNQFGFGINGVFALGSSLFSFPQSGTVAGPVELSTNGSVYTGFSGNCLAMVGFKPSGASSAVSLRATFSGTNFNLSGTAQFGISEVVIGYTLAAWGQTYISGGFAFGTVSSAAGGITYAGSRIINLTAVAEQPVTLENGYVVIQVANGDSNRGCGIINRGDNELRFPRFSTANNFYPAILFSGTMGATTLTGNTGIAMFITSVVFNASGASVFGGSSYVTLPQTTTISGIAPAVTYFNGQGLNSGTKILMDLAGGSNFAPFGEIVQGPGSSIGFGVISSILPAGSKFNAISTLTNYEYVRQVPVVRFVGGYRL